MQGDLHIPLSHTTHFFNIPFSCRQEKISSFASIGLFTMQLFFQAYNTRCFATIIGKVLRIQALWRPGCQDISQHNLKSADFLEDQVYACTSATKVFILGTSKNTVLRMSCESLNCLFQSSAHVLSLVSHRNLTF